MGNIHFSMVTMLPPFPSIHKKHYLYTIWHLMIFGCVLKNPWDIQKLPSVWGVFSLNMILKHQLLDVSRVFRHSHFLVMLQCTDFFQVESGWCDLYKWSAWAFINTNFQTKPIQTEATCIHISRCTNHIQSSYYIYIYRERASFSAYFSIHKNSHKKHTAEVASLGAGSSLGGPWPMGTSALVG